MIQLLLAAILGEMVVILTLIFKTPLRKLVLMALDRAKRGSGPLVVKTIAGVVFAVFLVNIYNLNEIQDRSVEALNTTDQILSAKYLLEASLMGFLLFLLLMIDKLHHYIRELRFLRKTTEVSKKQSKDFEDGKSGSAQKLKAMGHEISLLKDKIAKLKSECETKDEELKVAEAGVVALKTQSEGFLLEYDHLLEENQNLRDQVRAIE